MHHEREQTLRHKVPTKMAINRIYYIDEYQTDDSENHKDGATCQKIRMFYVWPAMRIRLQDREERVGETA